MIVSGDRPGRQAKLDAFDAARQRAFDGVRAIAGSFGDLIGDGFDKLAGRMELEATFNELERAIVEARASMLGRLR